MDFALAPLGSSHTNCIVDAAVLLHTAEHHLLHALDFPNQPTSCLGALEWSARPAPLFKVAYRAGCSAQALIESNSLSGGRVPELARMTQARCTRMSRPLPSPRWRSQSRSPRTSTERRCPLSPSNACIASKGS
jgi:hypothetical protein